MSHNIDFATLSGNYSLSEQDTGFRWLNGNKIYKKTINFGQLPNASVKTVAINVSDLQYILKIEGIAWGSNIFAHLPYVNPSSAQYQVEIYINEQRRIVVATGDNKSFYTSCYVTIYYTKTTG